MRRRGDISRVNSCGIDTFNRRYLLLSMGNEAFDSYNCRTVSGRVSGQKEFGSYRRGPRRIIMRTTWLRFHSIFHTPQFINMHKKSN